MARKHQDADRLLTRAIETLAQGEWSPRRNIFHCGLDWAAVGGVTAWEFKKTSTVLPSLWLSAHRETRDALAELGGELFASGARFLRLLVEPRAKLPRCATIHDAVRWAHAFFGDARRVLKRANARLRRNSPGVEVVLVASQCGVRGGRLRPHVHALLMCDSDISPEDARRAVASLFDDLATARVAWASEKNRAFLKRKRDVQAHVSYLFQYPVAGYVSCDEKEKDIAPLLLRSPRETVAALAALNENFSLKNSVVSLGAFRAKPTPSRGSDFEASASVPHTTKENGKAEIRVAAQRGEADFAGEKRPRKMSVVEGKAVPLWEAMLARPTDAPQCPPPRRELPPPLVVSSCKGRRSKRVLTLLPMCQPVVLAVIDEPTSVRGFARRRVLFRGCRGLTVEEIAKRFPTHGEAWMIEKNFDRLVKAGQDADAALSLAKTIGAAWRKRVEAPPANEEFQRWRVCCVLEQLAAATRPGLLALPAPNPEQDELERERFEALAAQKEHERKSRKARAAWYAQGCDAEHSKEVIVLPSRGALAVALREFKARVAFGRVVGGKRPSAGALLREDFRKLTARATARLRAARPAAAAVSEANGR